MNQENNLVMHDMLESLREFDTPLVANTLDYLDTPPTHEWYMSGEIQSITPTLGPTVGVAVTCKIDTSTPEGQADAGLYWRQMEDMAAMNLPTVWVVEAVGSRPEHECIMGDGMAKMLYSVGCLGIVTSGQVRDVASLLTVPFAAYCRGTCVHHCALRVRAINVPVFVGGITVRPGEIIHAGCEGVIKVPLACANAVIQKAPIMATAEKEVHNVWRHTELSLADKRKHVSEVYTRHGFIVGK
jgi:4-hydroxy-4-methyl-2-oxoglutarate aldolase